MALIKLAALLASLLLTSTALAATTLPTISVKGSKFFDSNGKQFFIKGIAYQLVPEDPLLDVAQCTRDATLMKTLGTNSIRVYHVDPTKDHTGCMSVFAENNIYLWLDLDTFDTQIDQKSPSWNAFQYSSFAAVMDAFVDFTNLAGFWIGNEIITDNTGSTTAPLIKAAVSDMKAYRDSKKYRSVPIGYAAADIAELRPMLQNYLACGDSSAAIDFFGLNSYEWCGADTSYETSGYKNLQAMAEGLSIPIFFSETGCNVPLHVGRTFADQSEIFGPHMVDTWSGAMVYEWIQEENDYGLIAYGPTSGAFSRSGTPTAIAPDFTNLQNQWKTLNPTGVKSADYKPSFTAPACPASTAGGWLVNGNPQLKTLGVKAVTSAPKLATTGGSVISVPTATITVGVLTSGTSNPASAITPAPTSGGAPAIKASVSTTSSTALAGRNEVGIAGIAAAALFALL